MFGKYDNVQKIFKSVMFDAIFNLNKYEFEFYFFFLDMTNWFNGLGGALIDFQQFCLQREFTTVNCITVSVFFCLC